MRNRNGNQGMIEIILIRHSFTLGNTLNRYIGVTDEPLCEKGIELVKNNTYPDCELLYVSPMKRCIETASLIYPGKEQIIYNGFRECNFGDFENKNYIELDGNSDYQAWIDSNAKLPFPNGESHGEFKLRCVHTFYNSLTDAEETGCGKIAMVVHGGTIMSIMENITKTTDDFYKYHAKNGEGFILKIEYDSIHDTAALISEVEKI